MGNRILKEIDVPNANWNHMWIADSYDKNACNISGRNNGMESWTWKEYEEKKRQLGDKVVLVDMIGHPVEGSETISEEMFSGKYPDGTIFALYCHSGGTSWFFQMRYASQLSQYVLVNVKGGINAR